MAKGDKITVVATGGATASIAVTVGGRSIEERRRTSKVRGTWIDFEEVTGRSKRPTGRRLSVREDQVAMITREPDERR